MNVLLVGGQSFFVDQMINKLNKEGHRVFVISGSETPGKKYGRVYEQYDFACDSKVLHEVVESANPEAVIFLGAYDSNYWEKQGQRETVSYISGLMNLLTSLSMLDKPIRFLYLSGHQVYGGAGESMITEEQPPAPSTPWGRAIYQGELCCLEYGRSGDMDVRILRLDHVYGEPRGRRDLMEPFARMCREAAFSGRISADQNHSISLLHVKDAVQYVYVLLKAEACRHVHYNLSSGRLLGEAEIARAIAEGMKLKGEQLKGGNTFGDEAPEGDDACAKKTMLALDPTRFREEFGEKVFDDPMLTIPKVAAYIQKNLGRLYKKDKEEKKEGLWGHVVSLFRAAIPYLENTVMFIPFFMLNNRAVGSQYFARLDFYLLYVLLFAIVFGQQQATYSAILATAGFLFRQQYERSGFEVILDYNTYVWIAQIFILGLVVGYLKDRLQAMKGEHERELQYLSGHLENISSINAANAKIKNTLETQIINQNDSLGRLYEITSALERYAPDEVLFHAAEVIRDLFGGGDVAIYSVSNARYARLSASTSVRARGLGRSIEYRNMKGLYTEVCRGRVYVNRSMQKDYPMMANGIFAEDSLELIIMVWEIPMERMTLSQINMFRIIGYLVQNALLRANRYLKALDGERYRLGTRILEQDAFLTMVRTHRSAAERDLAEICILQLSLNGAPVEAASRSLRGMLRDTDYLGQLEDGELYILLSNTGAAQAGGIIDRIGRLGYGARICGDMEL